MDHYVAHYTVECGIEWKNDGIKDTVLRKEYAFESRDGKTATRTAVMYARDLAVKSTPRPNARETVVTLCDVLLKEQNILNPKYSYVRTHQPK